MTGPYGDPPIGLASNIMNLAGILTRRAALKVPRYQRPYTWTEKEVRRLIQDLRRAFIREATFYFIGQIVLVKNRHDLREISDGQQRLATLTMILAYVRDRLPARVDFYQNLIMPTEQGVERPRLILREEDASFYRGHVQERSKMALLAKLDEMGSDSKDNLIAAAGTIAQELKDISDADLDAFMTYVCRCATFNVVDADERGSAATVYNTVNDRGLELSAADNIKCDLLENSGLSDKEADEAARKWEELEDHLGRRHFATLLGLMPFLLTGEQLISPGDLAAFRDQVERSGGVRSFLVDKLPRYCDALVEIFNGAVDVGPASFDVNRRLRLMMQVENWEWAPAALAFLAEHRGEPERARRFFQALDRLTFACELSIVPANRQEKRFADAARYASNDDELYRPMQSNGRHGPLVLTPGEEDKFIQRLNHPSRKSRGMRLLMMRIESAMENGSILTLSDDATIEHILPKSPSPWWEQRLPDRVLREEAAHSIGNLLLVTDKQNKAAGNQPFLEKAAVYFKFPNAPVHALTRDIAGMNDWTLQAIGARQQRLLRVVCEDWDLVRG